MSDFKIDADKKGETLYVEHDNLLGDVKKRPDVKNLIKIKGFPASVEVSFAKPIDNPKKLFGAAEKAAVEFEKKVLETFESLVADVTQLQDDEKKKGDAKAADKADKRMKQATKDLKSLAGEFGSKIRKAVERELKALKEKDGKAVTASRTIFRGMELADDAFQGSVSDDDDDDLDPSVAGYTKALVKIAGDTEGLTKDETKLRAALIDALVGASGQIAKSAGKGTVDLEEYAKANPKVAKSVAAAAEDYADVADKILKLFKKVDKPLEGLIKQSNKDDKLGDNKPFMKALETLHEARNEIESIVYELNNEAESCERLFEGDYGGGKPFNELIKTFKKQDSTTNYGKEMAKAAGELEKSTKG
jgi:DNA repair ATPase RecN